MTISEIRPVAGTGLYGEGERRRVYAIAFDMDAGALQQAWPDNNWRNAYRQIRDFLANYGFMWKQGSLQFSSAEATPVTVVLAVQDMTKQFPWFASSVRDIRMLRIEEDHDLLPAVASVSPLKPHPVPDILDLFASLDQDNHRSRSWKLDVTEHEEHVTLIGNPRGRPSERG